MVSIVGNEVNHPIKGHRKDEQRIAGTGHDHKQSEEETALVTESNTAIEPEAVMFVLEHTPIASRTVMGPGSFEAIALVTVQQVFLVLLFIWTPSMGYIARTVDNSGHIAVDGEKNQYEANGEVDDRLKGEERKVELHEEVSTRQYDSQHRTDAKEWAPIEDATGPARPDFG